jgi:hypothetical protein
MWAASMIIDASVKDYDPPAVIHGLMTLVATAAFSSALVVRRNGNGNNGNGNEDSEER